MKRIETLPSEATRPLDALLDHVGPYAAFETLASLLPDAAVFVVDGDRNVVLWSEGAERVLGFSRKEVQGRMCLSGIRCRNCMLGCGLAEHGKIDGYPLEHFRSDGQVVAVRKYAKAFFDEDGAFAGGIEILIPSGPAFDPEPHELGLPDDAEVFHGLVSRDPAMKRAFQTVRNVAETDATVLVRGESGTGKELVARAIHAESHRRDGPFVAVNCAALTPSLIESELFGHKKGAFTGAVSDRPGLFVQANRGMLFLDEVAELPLEVQAKLLRVLEAHVVTPVGANGEIAVDVRIVAATHRALRQEVKRGSFREDLMYRLRVVPIFLPALRERQGDVELLLRRFLEEFNARGPRRVGHVAAEAMRALLDHPWPGNVRELRNVVEYAFAVGRGAELQLAELPPELREADDAEAEPRSPRESAAPSSEAQRIRRALDRAQGRVGEAASLLGMSRPTFWRKRKKYSL
uniref:Fis family PAS modulated sigma-54 specific transcriptional regulator n=1 Tax=uncultured bacterium UPO76 TaxID=1776993 RepID=A0A140E001_9BACT|nr:Fis family PAS modulated sigma-54 specific transcriptional regulator [uncultured bacterium UPO76]